MTDDHPPAEPTTKQVQHPAVTGSEV